jgi:hypothetical protein
VKFTLKDYQSIAVADVLRNLADAREDWHRRQRPVAFSLTATTGAGKTVMAAAVIEALFDGDDEFDFEADPGAVVLWFTDDPSLNEQTRFRLMEAGDRIAHSRLVVIESNFNQPKLEPGNVYFLNAQKLSRTSLLVRGDRIDGDQDALFDHETMPDLRAHTMWDILRNTIEDERLTLYLILDEAHRGMRRAGRGERAERETIVRRLVNGANGVPPVPIVLGISATVERFNQAMFEAQAHGRFTYPSVVVDAADVQASGLLKDDIRLDFPAEAGQFDTVLLRRGTRKIIEQTQLWADYARAQEPPVDPVIPLLVVQVPNTPSDELLLTAIRTIRDEWPDLEPDAIAHVFGTDGRPVEIGGVTLHHVSPETVQDRSDIRVLLAKDAISTGWDCPRAEVLVSFRPAKDDTHITQLLGRMVRTPLARRIPGDDRLNSVECVLPHFDRQTATSVAEVLLGHKEQGADGSGDSGGGDGRRVLTAPVDMHVNPAIPDVVWDAFDRLPSQTLPRKVAKPVKRLTALAQALARDGIRPNARKRAYEELFNVLDGLIARHRTRIVDAARGILTVEGETLTASVRSGDVAAPTGFSEVADDRSVEAEFKAAGRVISPDVARRYAGRIAIADDEDDGLFDAHVKVAALATIDGVRDELDREADALVARWLAEHRVAIKNLPDDRQAVYSDIVAMSPEPQRIDILRPRVRAEETEDNAGEPLPTRSLHLMADEHGRFPIGSLNETEVAVLDSEAQQPRFLGWYRNPSRPSADALAIAYHDAHDRWRRMCPDFVFFHGDDSDTKVSIVDPHGFHLADALPKLRGLCAFAEQFGDELHRIEGVSKMKDGTLRVLDLKAPAVRDAIRSATDAETLYLSNAASNY